jgi:predicted RNA-binding protein YlqC (UPF0109 family)
MTELVEMIAKSLVDEPDKVSVIKEESDGEDVITLRVASDDMGKVIGKQGRIAKAIRTVVKAAATKQDLKVSVEIESNEEAAEAQAAAQAASESDAADAPTGDTTEN